MITRPIAEMVAQDLHTGVRPGPARFLRRLFALFDEFCVRYCVLHSWPELPDVLSTDLDVSVHPDDKELLPGIFRRLKSAGFLPIQCVQYSSESFQFVFSWQEGTNLSTTAIDITFRHAYAGMEIPSVEEIFEHRLKVRDMWVAGPKTEFVYLLAKRLRKHKITPAQAEHFLSLLRELGRSEAQRLAERLLPAAEANELAGSKSTEALIHFFSAERHGNPFKTSASRLRAFASRLLSEGRRVVSRARHPVGLLVVALGPDGVGKSMVLARLSTALGPAFRSAEHYHWRPQLLAPRGAAAPVTNPHEQVTRGPILSSLFLGGFVLDYWLGWIFRIRPALVRARMVLFDRYLYDLLVDAKRSRFGAPSWVASLACRLIRTPDLILLFDADVETIRARKRELPPEELQRQRLAYRSLPFLEKRGTVISANASAEDTLRLATEAIAEFLAERFEQRHASWLAARP